MRPSGFAVHDVDEVLDSSMTVRNGSYVDGRWASIDGLYAIGGSGGPRGVRLVTGFEAALPRYGYDQGSLYLIGGRDMGDEIAIGWHGDPVDVSTGSFRQEETDLTVPNSDLQVARFYNSGGLGSGIFGAVWTSNWDASLDAYPTTAVLQLPTGQNVGFIKEDGNWATGEPFSGVLHDAGTGYGLEFEDGSVWNFDENGRLIQMVSAQDEGIDLVWAAHANVTITDKGGNQLVPVSYTHLTLPTKRIV